MVMRQINDPSVLVASSALRITANRGPGSFYGEKYNVDKVHEFDLEFAKDTANFFEQVFEDPGELASGSTSAVYDAERGRLFMHGA